MKKTLATASRRHTVRQSVDIQYHVVWSPRLRVWRIERNGHPVGENSSHKNYVVKWAIHLAHGDLAKGLDSVVCVQQMNGTFRLEWSHGG